MFFQKEWSKHWNELPRDVAESSSLEISTIPWTMPEQDSVTSELDPALGTALDQITSKSLQPKLFYDFMKMLHKQMHFQALIIPYNCVKL